LATDGIINNSLSPNAERRDIGNFNEHVLGRLVYEVTQKLVVITGRGIAFSSEKGTDK
jgi:hypothetical protein